MICEVKVGGESCPRSLARISRFGLCSCEHHSSVADLDLKTKSSKTLREIIRRLTERHDVRLNHSVTDLNFILPNQSILHWKWIEAEPEALKFQL